MPASGITPSDIDTGLDRPLTPDETTRLTTWIADAETRIGIRFPAGTVLDETVLAMVVRMAVEYRWEQTATGGASSVTVSVDDGSVTRRYESGSPKGAAWWFLPEWWGWLDPASGSAAYSTRPAFERDTVWPG